MKNWSRDAIFYHIYPLGFCAAPPRNDFTSPTVHRLEQIVPWLDHIAALGVNAIYLGPVFESSAHGYDTVDYYHVDRRLGNNATLAALSTEVHQRGMRLVLDAVFNHVGRDFWAFYDLRQNGQQSPYKDWFYNLRFGERNAYGDAFTYEGWSGHTSLVKLNLHNPAVKQHIFEAVASWIEAFNIDGLRLDAADAIDLDFLEELAAYCKAIRPDFWLMGEVVHGDYTAWANPQTLDSVTNYECYKGLYSSLNDANYFEIAYALKRQFGTEGIYRNLSLYNFVDNHDVNRVASNLHNPAQLYPLYLLLFSIPGVPAIYYGSEWGVRGKRTPSDDRMLRPALDALVQGERDFDLAAYIGRLAGIRQATPALKYGDYQPLHVAHQQFAFLRQVEGQRAIIALNAAGQPAALELHLPDGGDHEMRDVLNDEVFSVVAGVLRLESVPAYGGRILVSG
jgi:cyclomaltodextrinase